MKTLLKLSFYLIVAMLAFTSCKKDDDNKPAGETGNSAADVVGVWVATDVKGEIKPRYGFGEEYNMVDALKLFFVGTENSYKADGSVKIAFSLGGAEEYMEDGEGEVVGKYVVSHGVIVILGEDQEVLMKGRLKVSGNQMTITVPAEEQIRLMADEEDAPVELIKLTYNISDVEYVYTKK